MTDLAKCIAIEEGLPGLSIALLFVVLLLAFLYPSLWMLVKVFKLSSKDDKSGLRILIGESPIFEGKGRISALAIPLLWIGAVVIGLYFAWSRFADYTEWRSVAVDTSGSARTLDEIREKMSQDPKNRVTVMVSSAVKDLSVQGRFEGKCVSDLFANICRKYYRDLRCEVSVNDRAMRIESATRK